MRRIVTQLGSPAGVRRVEPKRIGGARRIPAGEPNCELTARYEIQLTLPDSFRLRLLRLAAGDSSASQRFELRAHFNGSDIAQ